MVGPIPWTVIVAYGDRKGLDRDLMDLFEVVMRALDEAYLAWQRESKVSGG